ncbi:MAG: MlaD family protein [Solirubrobacteraceae bacterium]
MSRRPNQSRLTSNPIVIGSLTVLVTIVAVMLAYNATAGLPFVPSYTLHVRTADAEELQYGDDVYIGGTLVGTVSSVTATRTSTGRPIGVENLHLQKSIEPLPADSTFIVRLKGSIGLKYLQITPGHSKQVLADNATVPMSQAGAEVDFDQVLSMFTPPTQVGVRRSTIGFGEALAGRGSDINSAIGAFVPLFDDLGPVARNLASPHTNLAGFFRGLESYSGALAPVAQTQATLFGNLDTTFRALAGVAVPYLQDAISQTPPTFQTTIADAPVIRPFLVDTAGLLHDLRPGAATLTQSAPVLAQTFAAGTRNLPGTAALDRRTVALSRKLETYGENPNVQGGLDRLSLTAESLRSPLAFLTPVQASCNYVTLFLRNISSVLADRVSQGGLLRFVQVAISDGPGYESSPSQRPYTGPAGPSLGPLHVNPYPNTDSPGQTPECAAGNEHYSGKHAVLGNPPGNLGLNTEQTKRSGG